MTTTLTPFDPADYLDNDDVIAEYLTAAIEEEGIDGLLDAFGDVWRTKGMSKLALTAGKSRPSLYKSLRAGGNPRFSTVLEAAQSLGLSFQIVAMGKGERHPAPGIRKRAAPRPVLR